MKFNLLKKILSPIASLTTKVDLATALEIGMLFGGAKEKAIMGAVLKATKQKKTVDKLKIMASVKNKVAKYSNTPKKEEKPVVFNPLAIKNIDMTPLKANRYLSATELKASPATITITRRSLSYPIWKDPDYKKNDSRYIVCTYKFKENGHLIHAGEAMAGHQAFKGMHTKTPEATHMCVCRVVKGGKKRYTVVSRSKVVEVS